jgi:hypothetical protein
MPTPQQVYENRRVTLDRLIDRKDRIVWQRPDANGGGGLWWQEAPQLGCPRLWLSTCKWLLRRGFIAEGMRPKDSLYREYKHVGVYVATPAALDAFIDLKPS